MFADFLAKTAAALERAGTMQRLYWEVLDATHHMITTLTQTVINMNVFLSACLVK